MGVLDRAGRSCTPARSPVSDAVPAARADLVGGQRTLDPANRPERLTEYPAPLLSERSHRFPPGHRARVLASTDRVTASAMAEGYRSAARTASWPNRLRLVAMAGWWASAAEEISSTARRRGVAG